jgi:hypothetical protein
VRQLSGGAGNSDEQLHVTESERENWRGKGGSLPQREPQGPLVDDNVTMVVWNDGGSSETTWGTTVERG